MSLFKHSLVRLLCLFMIIVVVTARPGKSRRLSARNNRENRLINGDEVKTNNTFLASLRVMPKELHRCGGFLISRLHIMTTATCIYSTGTKELHAYMNPLRLDNLGTYIKVKEVVSHPNFTLTPHENDIAILTLEREHKAPFPIIPDWVDLPPKSQVFTYGWGYEKVQGGVGNFTLHEFKLQVMPNGLCSLVLREYLSCDTLCATSASQFSTSPGDVGTPLVHIHEGKLYAIGMLVKETDDMVNAAPYLRLRQYLDWIKEVAPTDTETTTLPPPTTTSTETTAAEETTTTAAPEEPVTTTTEAPPGLMEDDYGFSDDYHEQPIKGRSRKRAAFHRQMFRDPSVAGNRQFSHFG